MAIDGEILPDETDSQARARVERRERAALAPAAQVALDLPTGRQIVLLTADEFDTLVAGQLYIAFYNLSGQLPDRHWDFSGIPDLSVEERRNMPRYHGLRAPNGARLHFYLTDGQPMKVDKRVAFAPIHRDERRRRWTGERRDDVLRVNLTWEKTAWVTHFAIGSRERGIVMGAQLNAPMAVLPGGGFKFGLKVEDIRKALMPSGTPLEVESCLLALPEAEATNNATTSRGIADSGRSEAVSEGRAALPPAGRTSDL